MVPVSNNDVERALRYVVIGRKNFAGSKAINDAEVAATIYIVIESSKKVSIQPKEYIKHVITEHRRKLEPLSPTQFSIKKFGGRSKDGNLPPKDQWQVRL